MRVLAKLKLTEPNAAKKIALGGKMRAVFNNAHEMSADVDWFAVFADAKDPKAVIVEAGLRHADGFADALRKEKHFDCLYKFFDIIAGGQIKPWLNYVEQMCFFDGDVVYGIPSFCLTQPTAEDACIDVTAELDCNECDDDVFNKAFVAVWIRRQDKDTDIILPIYPRIMYATTNNTVELAADTYDDSSERLSPDVYRPVLDVIDDLVDLKSPCQMMAIHSEACCGDEIDLSETVYPISRLCLNFTRHSKNYSIILDSAN